MISRLLPGAVLAAALALAWAGGGLATAHAQESVSVNGVVVNGTHGGAAPQEALVLLLMRDRDGKLSATSQARSDASGRFHFDQLPRLEGGSYTFSVDHGGVLYTQHLDLAGLSGGLNLTVYDTTRDASVVRVTRQVLVVAGVDQGDRQITAIEFVHLSNTSDRTLAPDPANPGQMSFIRFSLPPRATELSVQSDLGGGQIVSVGTGFALTLPVLPGDHSVEFSYRFPYQGDSLAYRQTFHQGAGVYQVLLPDWLSPVQIAPLVKAAPVNIQGSVYQVWEGRDFSPGQAITLELSNLPQPALLSRLGRGMAGAAFWQAALPAILGTVLASLLLLGAFKTPLDRRRPAGSALRPSDGTAAGRARLVREIADLDDDFQRGRVPDLEYRGRRRWLKSRILAPRQPGDRGENGPAAAGPPAKRETSR